MDTVKDDGLDARVAAEVMGWVRGARWGNGNGEWVIAGKGYKDHGLSWSQTPRFSERLQDAWQVVERLSADAGCGYYPFVLREDRYSGSYSGGKWLCSFDGCEDQWDEALGGDNDAMEYWDRKDGWIAAAHSPAKAICLAALKALGRNKP